jgi:hypothetical protein
MRKMVWAFAILAGSLFILTTVGNHKAAAFFTQYCDVLADPSSPGSGNAANCQNGQNNNGLTGLDTSSQAALKKSFINKIVNYANDGYGFQQKGAAYIENHLQQYGGNWQDNVNDSSVTLSIGTIPNAYACDNTAYYAPDNEIVPTGDCAYGYSSLLFTQNGKLVFIIKIDCGNPMGSLGGPTAHQTPQNNPPTGSITVSCNIDGTANLKFTYNDPDGKDDPGNPNQTAAYTRIEKVSAGYSFGDYYSGDTLSTNNNWDRQNYGASPTTQNNVKGDGTLEVWLYVGDDGPNAPNQNHGNNYYASDYPTDHPTRITCKQPTSPPPSQTGNCPGDPTIDANTLVTLQTPYVTPQSGSWTGTTSDKGNLQYQYIATSNSNFTSIDISSGGQRTPPPIVSYGTNKQTVTVNYQKFVDNYPYDSNQAEATYQTNYTKTTWKADTFDHWACDNGPSGPGTTTRSGSTCTYTPKRTSTTSCPSEPYPLQFTQMTTSGQCHYNYTAPASGNCSPYSGPSKNNKCYLNVNPVTTYYCDGTKISGSTCPSKTFSATAYYQYTNQGTVSGLSRNNTSTASSNYKMSACFARNFNVISVAVTASKNSNENPSSGSASATADVRFSAPKGMGVRVPYSIKSGLSFTARMQGQLLVCSNSASGPLTVTSGSTGTSAEVSAAPIPGISCTVSQPPPLGGQVCATYTVTPTGDKVNAAGVIVVGDGGMVSGSNCSTPVVNEPYLKVFGGDVAAGTGFLNGNNVSCTNSSTASIQTFNTGVNPYGGSGTALAALSVKPIATNITDEGFASAQGGGITGSTVAAPKTLSFGNDDATSKYGGDYGTSSSGCSPDYYSGAPVLTASNSLAGTVDLSSLNGTYVAADTLQLSGTITQGQHVLIYSAWPVTISGPIAFSNPGATIADMPSFSLVVKNNDINIASNVSNLAGNYIAQNGTINDCDTTDNIYPACNTKLTVYGSFVANNIEFYRMGQNGSLRYSTTDSGPGSNNASEEFDYGPATWLAQPPASGTPPAYDAVTSLPPVL